MKLKTVIVAAGACTLLAASIVLSAPKAAPPWKIPFFKARTRNPVPATAQSVATGEDIYIHNCESCHGKNGKGDGPKAATLDVRPGNLTAPQVAKESDGALYWKITDGRRPMPNHRKLLTKQQRWEVVNYIRTFTSSHAKGK